MARRFGGLLICLLGLAMLTRGGGVIGGSAPFPSDKLSVLVVEESSDHNTPAWVNGTSATAVRTLVKAQDGEMLLLDQHDDMAKMAPKWQAAMKVERKSLPWIVASDGRRGFSAPVTTQDDAMKLLAPMGVK